MLIFAYLLDQLPLPLFFGGVAFVVKDFILEVSTRLLIGQATLGWHNDMCLWLDTVGVLVA